MFETYDIRYGIRKGENVQVLYLNTAERHKHQAKSAWKEVVELAADGKFDEIKSLKYDNVVIIVF